MKERSLGILGSFVSENLKALKSHGTDSCDCFCAPSAGLTSLTGLMSFVLRSLVRWSFWCCWQYRYGILATSRGVRFRLCSEAPSSGLHCFEVFHCSIALPTGCFHYPGKLYIRTVPESILHTVGRVWGKCDWWRHPQKSSSSDPLGPTRLG